MMSVAGHASRDGDIHRLKERGRQPPQENLRRIHSQHHADVCWSTRPLPDKGMPQPVLSWRYTGCSRINYSHSRRHPIVVILVIKVFMEETY